MGIVCDIASANSGLSDKNCCTTFCGAGGDLSLEEEEEGVLCTLGCTIGTGAARFSLTGFGELATGAIGCGDLEAGMLGEVDDTVRIGGIVTGDDGSCAASCPGTLTTMSIQANYCYDC
jgi:hypothetical protein